MLDTGGELVVEATVVKEVDSGFSCGEGLSWQRVLCASLLLNFDCMRDLLKVRWRTCKPLLDMSGRD